MAAFMPLGLALRFQGISLSEQALEEPGMSRTFLNEERFRTPESSKSQGCVFLFFGVFSYTGC